MSDQPKLQVSLSSDIQFESMVTGVFLDRALASGYGELTSVQWQTTEPSLAGLGETTLHFGSERHETSLYEWDGAHILVHRWGSHIDASVAADSVAQVDAVIVRLRSALGSPDPVSKHEVNVSFWTYGRQGPQRSFRSITVPEWEDVHANYSASTRAGLEAIMRGFAPAHGGQLILWHGAAGTGKTFALRALAWEWREWCEFHYIVDPDSLFGEHADYLMSVLLEEGAPMLAMRSAMRQFSMGSGGFSSYAMVGDTDDDAETERAWRVLVLEDTGELLSAEARVAVGQGLSRFLNVVDGLIGQGLRVLVLVTTNEAIRSLHPAVARPGRAAANIEFTPLAADEAREWLAGREVDQTVEGPATLATLFARAEGRDPDSVELATFGDE